MRLASHPSSSGKLRPQTMTAYGRFRLMSSSIPRRNMRRVPALRQHPFVLTAMLLSSGRPSKHQSQSSSQHQLATGMQGIPCHCIR